MENEFAKAQKCVQSALNNVNGIEEYDLLYQAVYIVHLARLYLRLVIA